MKGKPYSVYKRKAKGGGVVWYVRFKNSAGRFGSGVNTHKGHRREAEAWAVEYLREHGIEDRGGAGLYVPMSRDVPTLTEFVGGVGGAGRTRSFFDWDGPWSLNRRVSGKRTSPRNAKEKGRLLEQHVLPVLGELRLTDITTRVIKEFRNDLYQRGISGSTINKALGVVWAVLVMAEEQEIINGLPRIERAANRPKQRGILTVEEVRRLFSPEATWTDRRGRAGSLLAASTGLRLGEIQGLTLEDLHLYTPSGHYLRVWRSWDEGMRGLNDTTKNGRERTIFLPDAVAQELRGLLAGHPRADNPQEHLFYSDVIPGKPAEQRVFTRSLYRALASIGIDDAERRRRGIVFHSHRHFLNSLLVNAKIPLFKIQSITGHLSPEMTSHYYHVDDARDVLKVVEDTLFAIIIC